MTRKIILNLTNFCFYLNEIKIVFQILLNELNLGFYYLTNDTKILIVR